MRSPRNESDSICANRTERLIGTDPVAAPTGRDDAAPSRAVADGNLQIKGLHPGYCPRCGSCSPETETLLYGVPASIVGLGRRDGGRRMVRGRRRPSVSDWISCPVDDAAV